MSDFEYPSIPNAAESEDFEAINFEPLLFCHLFIQHTNTHNPNKQIYSEKNAKTVDDLDAFCDDLFLRFYISDHPIATAEEPQKAETSKPTKIKIIEPAHFKSSANSTPFSPRSPKHTGSLPQTPIYSATSSPVPTILNISNDSSEFRSRDINDIIQSNLSISQIVHSKLVCRLIANQNGSRFVQRLLKRTNNSAEISLLIAHCMERVNLLELSEDVYGNYIVQLFLSKCNEMEQQMLLDMFIKDNFLRLSKSMYGCRVIQKALNCITNIKMLRELVQSFHEQTKTDRMLHESLICPYRNHVVQAILDLRLNARYVKFIGQEIERRLVFYCEHIIGSRIVQCFIKNYGDKLNILKLLEKDSHLYLSKLKYGNYVIQCIVNKGAWYSNLKIIDDFKNRLIRDVFDHQNILFLSKNKYGSNVVEVCIQGSSAKQKSMLMHVLSRNHYLIPSLVQHCYGNYVVKSLLLNLCRQSRDHLIRLIRTYCSESSIKKDLLEEIQNFENGK